MTVNSGKNISKRRKGSTKLAPGSWLDNLPDPFHTAKEVNALFDNIERERKEKKAKESKK
jgi:hypothetical protein